MENPVAETSDKNSSSETKSIDRDDTVPKDPESVEILENHAVHDGEGHLKVALDVQPSSEVLIVPKHVGPATDDGNSVASSCSSQKGKLRLHLELNLQPKEPIAAVLAGSLLQKGNSERNDGFVDTKEPVTVMVDYPDDMKISVNARIHKLHLDSDLPRHVPPKQVGEDEGVGWKNEDQLDINQNEGLNSTFVKETPLTSTLIYPIIEEKEGNAEVKIGDSPFFAKSGSGELGEVSLYQTVMGDNGFGNLSAISNSKTTMDNKRNTAGGLDIETEDPSKVVKKHPTLNLSGGSSYISLHKTTDELSPSEKLIKALHILAKYRGVWGIYEDENRIVVHLRKLNEILGTTDNATVQKTCKEDDYQEVRGLVSYFVLEKRFTIRSELLQTFSLLVEKSNAVANFIFSSEFPVVLAWEITRGNYVSKETYAYAYCFLQVLKSVGLTNFQCESAGVRFYSQIVNMMCRAEKNHYRQVAELFFEIILLFHGQLDEDSDFKWKCLYEAADLPNRTFLKKFKLKLVNILLKTDMNESALSEGKMKDALIVLKDLIICNSTINIFTNTELDIILLALNNTLEQNHGAEYTLEALKTVYRILVTIQKQPSGLHELRRLVKTLLKEEHEASASGDRIDRNCYWGVLKKIYKIITM